MTSEHKDKNKTVHIIKLINYFSVDYEMQFENIAYVVVMDLFSSIKQLMKYWQVSY